MPVGSYPKGISPYGVHDMAGNVEEWVYDCSSDSFYDSVDNTRNPVASDEENCSRITRGGSAWSPPLDIRTTIRNSRFPNDRNFLIGARCVWQP